MLKRIIADLEWVKRYWSRNDGTVFSARAEKKNKDNLLRLRKDINALKALQKFLQKA